jgi:2-polyprenyl-6-methoxyphenol hydroxylase-like FAD-dependent oxidoreductase
VPSPLVLIVGAGPTGMTLALELKRFGLDVRLIDKATHMAQHSQALVVQARTLEQFQRYGIAEEAVRRGRKLNRAKLWSEGKEIVDITLDQIPGRYPYLLFLPQSETEAILNHAMEAAGLKAERGTELLRIQQIPFQQDGCSVSARLRHPDGGEEQVTPRWVIGCDGAHSTVRQQSGIPFQGGGIDLNFFLGDLELEGPDVPDDALSVHLHQGDVVFMGRLSDRLTRVIVALHGVAMNETKELTLADFQQAIDRSGVRVRAVSSDWMTPFRVSDRQAERYRLGCLFLAGDASHIHSPVGGQGMNTGIQDAANLAWKLAAVARGAEDSLLDSYDEERGAVGKQLLSFTERGLKLATNANPLVEGLRDALAPLLTSLKPVQKAAAGFISETAIEYRSSSIVADHGGDGSLRAGDRMPDLATSASAAGLLADWRDARHLAVALNASEDELSELRNALAHADVVPLSSSTLDDAARHQTGSGSKLMIVRPDGYLGFRGSLDGTKGWREYARQDALLLS